MTGSAWILAAAAIFALIYAIGLRARTTAAQRTLAEFEPQIPEWVNQGNRAVIGQYEEILAMIHEAAHIELWERELPRHKDRDDPSYCETCGGRCQVDPS